MTSVRQMIHELNEVDGQMTDRLSKRFLAEQDLMNKALYYDDGVKRKVMAANGKLYTPNYSGRRLHHNTLAAVIRIKGIGVSGTVLLGDSLIFEPHDYGQNADLCPSWLPLAPLKVFDAEKYDLQDLFERRESLTLDETQWMAEYADIVYSTVVDSTTPPT